MNEAFGPFAISSDGKWLYAAELDSFAQENDAIIVWDVRAGAIFERVPLPAPEKIGVMQVSSDGKRLLTTNQKGLIDIWDIPARKIIRAMPAYTHALDRAQFSTDGKFIVSSAANEPFKLWDADTGQRLRTIRRSTADLAFDSDFLFSPDSRRFAIGADGILHVYELPTARELGSFYHSGNQAGFTYDGKWVATYDTSNREILITELDSLNDLIRIPVSDEPLALEFSPDKKLLVAVNRKNALAFDTQTGKPGDTERFNDEIEQMKWDRWSLHSKSDSITVYDLVADKTIGTLAPKRVSLANPVISRDGRWLVSLRPSASTLTMWDLSRGTMSRDLLNCCVNVGTFSPDGHLLAWPKDDFDGIEIWDMVTGRTVSKLAASAVMTAAFDPAGRMLAISTEKGVELWDITKPEKIAEFAIGVAEPSFALAFSTDGLRLAAAPSDRGIIWATKGKAEVHLEGNPLYQVTELAFSEDGNQIFANGLTKLPEKKGDEDWSASLDAEATQREAPPALAVWDAATGHLVEISVQPNRIAGVLKLWNAVESGNRTGATQHFRPSAWGTPITFDGSIIVSGRCEGLSCIRDSATGREIAAMGIVSDSGEWIIVTPDGHFDGSDAAIEAVVRWRVGGQLFPASKFEKQFRVPGLLKLVFQGKLTPVADHESGKP